METFLSAFHWLQGPGGAAVFAALFAISEAIGSLPNVKASGVFQAIFNTLGWIKANLLTKKP